MKLFAKKSLGQHFLNSKHVLEQIIQAAAINPGEIVLEIGPGTGILTEELLKTGARVISIEKDDRAIAPLKEKFASFAEKGNLNLIQGDILELTRSDLDLKEGGYAVVANIPYYITGAILESFLEHEPRPSQMVLLIQKEVADRIIARDSKESILSISVKAFGAPSMVAKVPPGAFTPPPSVDSAILKIDGISDIRFKENNLEIGHFFKIVRAGFAHKRKYAKSNLSGHFSPEKLDFAWRNNGLNEKARAEDLSLEQWISLAAAL